VERVKESVSERKNVLVAEVKNIVSRSGSGLGVDLITITDEQLGGALLEGISLPALTLHSGSTLQRPQP